MVDGWVLLARVQNAPPSRARVRQGQPAVDARMHMQPKQGTSPAKAPAAPAAAPPGTHHMFVLPGMHLRQAFEVQLGLGGRGLHWPSS